MTENYKQVRLDVIIQTAMIQNKNTDAICIVNPINADGGVKFPPVPKRAATGFASLGVFSNGVNVKRQKSVRRKHLVFVDSIVKIERKKQILRLTRAKSSPRKFWISQRFYLPIAILVVLISASFIAGAYFTWRTDKSLARDENQTPTVSSPSSPAPSLPVVEGAAALGPISQVPNEVLFNLTLDQLEIYLAEALKTPEMKEAERLAARKEKLKEYLEEKRSPFVEIVNTIAELKHWKLILAISNSESTLGKRCYNNNCSGIGVEPGHPLWREYENKAEWAKDLDRLIEKRYKDWTLEEMNGVYNQPGSQNWLLASKQVLEEMQERGIE